MGLIWDKHVKYPDIIPDGESAPTFDPLYGFPNGRRPREMIATEDEMIGAKLPMELRDYCAHLYLKFEGCKADVFPFVYKCRQEKHEYETCEYEDYVLRMKEFEREKRLRERKKRKQEKEQALAA